VIARAATGTALLVICAGCGSHSATATIRSTTAAQTSNVVVAGVTLPRHVWTQLRRECRDYVTDPAVPASERAARATNLVKVIDAAKAPDAVRCVTLKTGP
jgi:hypothetical protein